MTHDESWQRYNYLCSLVRLFWLYILQGIIEFVVMFIKQGVLVLGHSGALYSLN